MFIRKRDKNDCVVAAVAMFAQVSYKKALESAPYYPKDGISKTLIPSMIYKITGIRVKIYKRTYQKSLKNYRPDKISKILLITKPGQNHCIFTDGTYFYDPDETRPVLIKNAQRSKKWSSWYCQYEIY